MSRGRTGRAFYSETLGLKPDLMALGKALGAGVPIGAAMFSENVASKAAFGDHGSTYGGNLLACRAALVFLTELTEHGLMNHVTELGRHAEASLAALASRHSAVKEIRGAGVIWGIEIDRPAAEVVQAALERGLLITRTSDTVIRLLPAFIITAEEFDAGLAILDVSDWNEKADRNGSVGSFFVRCARANKKGRARRPALLCAYCAVYQNSLKPSWI